MEQLFEAARESVENSNWSCVVDVSAAGEVQAPMRVDQLSRVTAPSLMRVVTRLALLPRIAEQLLRPEVLFHTRLCEIDREVHACQLQKVNSPGDVVALMKQERRPLNEVLSLCRPAIGRLGVFDPTTVNPYRQTGTLTKRIRAVLRNNFPASGCHSLGLVQSIEDVADPTEEASELTSSLRNTTILIESSDDAQCTRFTMILASPGVPQSLVRSVYPAIGAKILDRMSRLFLKFMALSDSELGDFLSMDDLSYEILSLRKCARGGPMLPVLCPESGTIRSWEAVAPGGTAFSMTLPDYLREFLSRLGLPAMPIHNRWNGWRLPPFQAAVRRDHWRQLWSVLEEPFRDMRAAYRRHVGGTAAPELSTQSGPRLLGIASIDATEQEDVATLNPRKSDTALAAQPIPVRSTFLHFHPSTSRQLVRSNSLGVLPQPQPAEDLERNRRQETCLLKEARHNDRQCDVVFQ